MEPADVRVRFLRPHWESLADDETRRVWLWVDVGTVLDVSEDHADRLLEVGAVELVYDPLPGTIPNTQQQ